MSKAQQTARRCANEYQTELSEDIQTAAATGNNRGMYKGIKKALGQVQSKTAPFKSSTVEIITDRSQQTKRWMEQYSNLYFVQNIVFPSAIDCLPTMDELDAEPAVKDLSKAIDCLASGKVPGSDGIPPDPINHCKSILLFPLYEVLCQC